MPVLRLYCSGNNDDNAEPDAEPDVDENEDAGGCGLVLNLNLDCSFRL